MVYLPCEVVDLIIEFNLFISVQYELEKVYDRPLREDPKSKMLYTIAEWKEHTENYSSSSENLVAVLQSEPYYDTDMEVIHYSENYWGSDEFRAILKKYKLYHEFYDCCWVFITFL